MKFADPIFLSRDEIRMLAELAGDLPLADYVAAVLRDHLAIARGEQKPHQLVQRFLDGTIDARITILALERALQEAEKRLDSN